MTATHAAGDEPDTRFESGCLAVVLLLVALVWSGITGAFDTIVGRDAIHQWQAESYPTTTGTVVVSHVEDDDYDAHSVIRYVYRVAGKQYEANRYRYEAKWCNRGNARRIVDAYPLHSQVVVHYDAEDPSNAVLETGVDGRNLFLFMATLPFNLVLVNLWVWLGHTIYSGRHPPVAGGAKVWEDGTQTRVRISEWPPIVTAWGIALLLSIGAIFFVGIPFGFNPPAEVMIATFAVIFACATFTYMRRRRKLASGDFDLVIDNPARSLTLPRTNRGLTGAVVKFETLSAVEVETLETRDARGELKHSRYAPTLVFTDRDGSTRREKLAEWSNKQRAERLAAWLRKRLGFKASNSS